MVLDGPAVVPIRERAAHGDRREVPTVRVVGRPGRHDLDGVRGDGEHVRDGAAHGGVRRGQVRRDDAATLR